MGGASQGGKGKRPISVKFEIPYFTTSGIQVRYLKIIEPKVSFFRLFSSLQFSLLFPRGGCWILVAKVLAACLQVAVAQARRSVERRDVMWLWECLCCTSHAPVGLVRGRSNLVSRTLHMVHASHRSLGSRCAPSRADPPRFWPPLFVRLIWLAD